MGQKSAIEEWEALAEAVAADGGPSFVSLGSEEISRLEGAFDLGPGTREVLDHGWPEAPIVVGDGDSFFAAPDDLVRYAERRAGWRSSWLPVAFGRDDGFVLFLDDEDDSVWAVFADDAVEGLEHSFFIEQVFRSLAAFFSAVRLTYQWVRPEHLELRSRGWFLFKERRVTLTVSAAEAIIRAHAPYFRDGPAILPGCAGYALLLEPPLDRIATSLAERE